MIPPCIMIPPCDCYFKVWSIATVNVAKSFANGGVSVQYCVNKPHTQSGDLNFAYIGAAASRNVKSKQAEAEIVFVGYKLLRISQNRNSDSQPH